ncbi:MAG: hypothetical protein ACOYKZ_01120 [Chlamydiia bacterium]
MDEQQDTWFECDSEDQIPDEFSETVSELSSDTDSEAYADASSEPSSPDGLEVQLPLGCDHRVADLLHHLVRKDLPEAVASLTRGDPAEWPRLLPLLWDAILNQPSAQQRIQLFAEVLKLLKRLDFDRGMSEPSSATRMIASAFEGSFLEEGQALCQRIRADFQQEIIPAADETARAMIRDIAAGLFEVVKLYAWDHVDAPNLHSFLNDQYIPWIDLLGSLQDPAALQKELGNMVCSVGRRNQSRSQEGLAQMDAMIERLLKPFVERYQQLRSPSWQDQSVERLSVESLNWVLTNVKRDSLFSHLLTSWPRPSDSMEHGVKYMGQLVQLAHLRNAHRLLIPPADARRQLAERAAAVCWPTLVDLEGFTNFVAEHVRDIFHVYGSDNDRLIVLLIDAVTQGKLQISPNDLYMRLQQLRQTSDLMQRAREKIFQLGVEISFAKGQAPSEADLVTLLRLESVCDEADGSGDGLGAMLAADIFESRLLRITPSLELLTSLKAPERLRILSWALLAKESNGRIGSDADMCQSMGEAAARWIQVLRQVISTDCDPQARALLDLLDLIPEQSEGRHHAQVRDLLCGSREVLVFSRRLLQLWKDSSNSMSTASETEKGETRRRWIESLTALSPALAPLRYFLPHCDRDDVHTLLQNLAVSRGLDGSQNRQGSQSDLIQQELIYGTLVSQTLLAMRKQPLAGLSPAALLSHCLVSPQRASSCWKGSELLWAAQPAILALVERGHVQAVDQLLNRVLSLSSGASDCLCLPLEKVPTLTQMEIYDRLSAVWFIGILEAVSKHLPEEAEALHHIMIERHVLSLPLGISPEEMERASPGDLDKLRRRWLHEVLANLHEQGFYRRLQVRREEDGMPLDLQGAARGLQLDAILATSMRHCEEWIGLMTQKGASTTLPNIVKGALKSIYDVLSCCPLDSFQAFVDAEFDLFAKYRAFERAEFEKSEQKRKESTPDKDVGSSSVASGSSAEKASAPEGIAIPEQMMVASLKGLLNVGKLVQNASDEALPKLWNGITTTVLGYLREKHTEASTNKNESLALKLSTGIAVVEALAQSSAFSKEALLHVCQDLARFSDKIQLSDGLVATIIEVLRISAPRVLDTRAAVQLISDLWPIVEHEIGKFMPPDKARPEESFRQLLKPWKEILLGSVARLAPKYAAKIVEGFLSVLHDLPPFETMKQEHGITCLLRCWPILKKSMQTVAWKELQKEWISDLRKEDCPKSMLEPIDGLLTALRGVVVLIDELITLAGKIWPQIKGLPPETRDKVLDRIEMKSLGWDAVWAFARGICNCGLIFLRHPIDSTRAVSAAYRLCNGISPDKIVGEISGLIGNSALPALVTEVYSKAVGVIFPEGLPQPKNMKESSDEVRLREAADTGLRALRGVLTQKPVKNAIWYAVELLAAFGQYVLKQKDLVGLIQAKVAGAQSQGTTSGTVNLSDRLDIDL